MNVPRLCQRLLRLWTLLSGTALVGLLLRALLAPAVPSLPARFSPKRSSQTLRPLERTFRWNAWRRHSRWRWTRRFWSPRGASRVTFVWDRRLRRVEARWLWRERRWRVRWDHTRPVRGEVWREGERVASARLQRQWLRRSITIWQTTTLARQPLLLLHEPGVQRRWLSQGKGTWLWIDATNSVRFAGVRALWSWDNERFRWQRWVRGRWFQGSVATLSLGSLPGLSAPSTRWRWRWRGWLHQEVPGQRWRPCPGCRLPPLTARAVGLLPRAPDTSRLAVTALLWSLLGMALFWGSRSPRRLRRVRLPSPVEHPFRYAVIAPALCPRELCEALREEADAGEWTRDRHTQPTQDQPLVALPQNRAAVERWLEEVAFVALAKDTGLDAKRLALREGFVVRYDQRQTKLDLHRDASVLTLSVALNDRREYQGGGTYFACLNDSLVLQETGDVLWHCGKLQHGGAPVHEGARLLLVCFLDTSACEEFHHEQIATWDSQTPSDADVMRRLLRPS